MLQALLCVLLLSGAAGVAVAASVAYRRYLAALPAEERARVEAEDAFELRVW